MPNGFSVLDRAIGGYLFILILALLLRGKLAARGAQNLTKMIKVQYKTLLVEKILSCAGSKHGQGMIEATLLHGFSNGSVSLGDQLSS